MISGSSGKASTRKWLLGVVICLIFTVGIMCSCSCDENSNGNPAQPVGFSSFDCEDPYVCISSSDCENSSGWVKSGYHCDGGYVCCEITGSTSTETDDDTDSGEDTDSHGCYASDAGPWEWEPLPDGEDCGEGCQQLTFSDLVFEHHWDVWGDYLAYRDESYRIKVINLAEKTVLALPSLHPEFGFGPNLGMTAYSPAVYNGKVAYSITIFGFSPPIIEIIVADLAEMSQEVISVFEAPELPADWIDIYGDRVVSAGGCGDVANQWLCKHDVMNGNCKGDAISDQPLTKYTSLWEDKVVFFRFGEDDIIIHNFSTHETEYLVDDDETQIIPRIFGSNVVYMDLRYGDSTSGGNWNHAAVFLLNIETQETTQITDGQWIASYPNIYENTVVWMDHRFCSQPNNMNDMYNIEIWGYDIQTADSFRITEFPGRKKGFPRIWGSKVFFNMYNENGYTSSIYQVNLPQ